ncbi:hypothetical protein PUN28_003361 [Cardiocondyla obscurior]|uniref:Uncharacterized protein n=1 Tax=Cardiocondyla obscurior TaxID=286306 RepID=A0AAW2GNQ0_9HYME
MKIWGGITLHFNMIRPDVCLPFRSSDTIQTLRFARFEFFLHYK